MVIIAVIGGWAGCMFTAFNTWVCIIRKRWAKWFKYRWALQQNTLMKVEGAFCWKQLIKCRSPTGLLAMMITFT